MMDIIRHVGKVVNTDQRCVVAFMQIPNREDHALVIPTDNLPPRYEQAVMDLLTTNEGQTEETFANVLSRHLMPDTRETILESLHNTGKLVAVPVNNIVMLPRPNQPVKLNFILEQLGRLTQQQVPNQFAAEKFNPHTANQRADQSENARAIARNLLVEAEMLETEAKKKRDLAYAQDASLRPLNGAQPAALSQPLNVAKKFDPWGEMKQAAEPYLGAMALAEAPNPVVHDGLEARFEARFEAMETMLNKLVESQTVKTPAETAEVPIEVATEESSTKLKARAKAREEG